MLESSDFLSLECLRIEAPYHALILFSRFRRRIVFRITPAGGHVVELAIAREGQPAAMVAVHIDWETQVTKLRGRPEILDSRPIAFIRPDAHQTRVRRPGGSVDAFAIGRRRHVIKHAVPTGLIVQVMRQQTGRDFQAVRLRRVPHQTSVVTTGPDAMPFVEEQSLRIDGANAANVASLAAAYIIDDEMIARV